MSFSALCPLRSLTVSIMLNKTSIYGLKWLHQDLISNTEPNPSQECSTLELRRESVCVYVWVCVHVCVVNDHTINSAGGVAKALKTLAYSPEETFLITVNALGLFATHTLSRNQKPSHIITKSLNDHYQTTLTTMIQLLSLHPFNKPMIALSSVLCVFSAGMTAQRLK